MTEVNLLKALKDAKINALNMEIERHNGWLENLKDSDDKEKLAQLTSQKEVLTAELRELPNREFTTLPEPYPEKPTLEYSNFKAGKVECTVWVDEVAKDGSILFIEEMSRSGPWYILAGINGDYSQLEPSKKYTAVFYTVAPRDYLYMPSAYVYLESFK